jgi:phage terminase small subunit
MGTGKKPVKKPRGKPRPKERKTKKVAPNKPGKDARLLAFCTAYIESGGIKADAARAMGSKAKNLTQAATDYLKNPENLAKLTEMLAAHHMSKEEVLKGISDIASGSLNDYYVEYQKEYTPRIQVPLRKIIEQTQADIEDKMQIIHRLGLKPGSKKEPNYKYDSKMEAIEELQEKIVVWEIELERNPAAYRIVDGPTQMVTAVKLDMVKLVKDKERGRIKAIKSGKFGMEIELYAADNALNTLAKYHGILKEKPDGPVINLNSEPLTKEEIKQIAKELENDY